MIPAPVFLDANVIFPISLANLVLRIAEEGLIEVFWSQHVLDKALTALKRDRPDLSPDRLDRRFAQMTEAFSEAMIDTTGLDSADYPSGDPEDQWVMAGAHRSPANVIITRNLSDFPEATLVEHGLQAKTADDLLLDLTDAHQETILQVIRNMQSDMMNPPLTLAQIIDSLDAAGVPRFATVLRPITT